MSSEHAHRERSSVLEDLRSPDDEVRRLAVERALALPVVEALPELLERLADSSWRVRKAAVGRLVACPGGTLVAEGLLCALGDADDAGRRNAALEALIGRGEEALETLVRGLACDDVDVRKLVVDALAGIASESARAPARAALADSDPNVRAAAAEALAAIGGDASREVLLDAATSDPERLVRLSALRGLERIGSVHRVCELLPVLEDRALCPAAYALLGHEDDAEALSVLKKGLAGRSRAAREAAMASLLRMIAGTDGDRVEALRADIREAALGVDRLLPEACQRLSDADLETRLVLVQFLGLVAAPECVLPILRASCDAALRDLARGVLEAMGETAEAAIEQAWGAMDGELLCFACAVLARTTGRLGALRLSAALESPDSSVRAAAARGLGQRRCPEALAALVRRLEATAWEQDCDIDEERAALEGALVSLAGADSGGLTGTLIELLSDRLQRAQEEGVRLSVARVLVRIGRPRDGDLVARLLKDPSSSVRRAAVKAVSRLDPAGAADPLRLALGDEAPAVRIAAAAVLGGSIHVGSEQDLHRILDDADERVRAAAIRAIGSRGAATTDADSRSRAAAAVAAHVEDLGLVAMAAVEALQALGGAEAASAARAALHRAEPELVLAAVRCIGAHGRTPDLDELIEWVGHPDWAVRAETIGILAERRVSRAVSAILRCLETERDGFVREAILRALERLEG